MKTNLLIILSLLLAATTSQAQPYLVALSKPGKAGIELRWSPMCYEAWQLGLSGGYMIERVAVLRNGKVLDLVERKILTPNPIKVADKSEWEKYENDNYAMVAGGCIFGESEIQQTLNQSLI
ncbi:MAG: hypothetical protein IKQ46_00280 [Bacteroidales bacterium]|nr:hypothetical protein [Bacteroidales bacterium]